MSQVLLSPQVIHKATLDVAEKGTDAAASTGMKVVLTSGLVDPVILQFNRPFVLIIRNTNTESILFLGKFANPQKT